MEPEVIFYLKKNLKKININEFIDKNSFSLKAEFLKVVESSGEIKIFNKSFKNFFQINEYVNLWDLSNFNEKNIFKEDYINKCLEFLAVLKIIKSHKLKYIILNNIDPDVYEVLKKYKKEINFSLSNKKKKKLKHRFKIFVLGNWFLSLLFFLKKNTFFNRKQRNTLNNHKNLIVSYFCHYKKDFNKEFFFTSDHWRGLEKIIKKNFFYLNLFIPSKRYKKYNHLKIDTKNQIINLQEKNFLNNYFYFEDFIKIIFLSFISSWKFYFLFLILRNKKSSQLPLLELSYVIQKRSFSGITCLENLKHYYSLKNFFDLNPSIKRCFYLMENQSWEKILLRICKKKKIDSIGYIHATMPFWHLNYYQTKSFNQKNIYLPNKIFTVSKINLELLLNQGIRKNKLKLVEALRYNWLNNVKKEKFSNSSNKILVFGDYERISNEKLLKLVKKFLKDEKNLIIYFKVHPGDITKYNSENKRLRIINDFPKKIKFKFFIFSNSTSASAEYSHLTDKIAIYKPNDSINLSPFKNLKNQNIFFSNVSELSNIINSRVKKKIKSFFYINNNLNNWKKNI